MRAIVSIFCKFFHFNAPNFKNLLYTWGYPSPVLWPASDILKKDHSGLPIRSNHVFWVWFCMVYTVENYTLNVLFDYNVSKQCSGDIPTEYCCEISIYISHFTIFAPRIVKLEIPKSWELFWVLKLTHMVRIDQIKIAHPKDIVLV